MNISKSNTFNDVHLEAQSNHRVSDDVQKSGVSKNDVTLFSSPKRDVCLELGKIPLRAVHPNSNVIYYAHFLQYLEAKRFFSGYNSV